jgi:hypothetical protein
MPIPVGEKHHVELGFFGEARGVEEIAPVEWAGGGNLGMPPGAEMIAVIAHRQTHAHLPLARHRHPFPMWLSGLYVAWSCKRYACSDIRAAISL